MRGGIWLMNESNVPAKFPIGIKKYIFLMANLHFFSFFKLDKLCDCVGA
jgi:hypothetical protein